MAESFWTFILGQLDDDDKLVAGELAYQEGILLNHEMESDKAFLSGYTEAEERANLT